MVFNRVYIETYGCQMNVSDSEVVAAILSDAGYLIVNDAALCDVVLINTCAIRDNAEVRILGRLAHFRHLRQTANPELVVGVLGCMAGRVREHLLDATVGANLVVGPDGYRQLPALIDQVRNEGTALYTTLSRHETYSDIIPLRYGANGITGFTSIMRGCDNMCTYCVVPFTRGRERSREPDTIVAEVVALRDAGYREVTLLGQNVDSYHWGPQGRAGVNFSDLIERVAQAVPGLRVRFSTSHPKDITDEVLYTMAMYENVCMHIHLPVQSGSNRMLERMRRGYTAEHYLGRVEAIRRLMPYCCISTDIIAGFCGETAADHEATLRLMEKVRFDSAFMFKYSERPGTYAARHWDDDVPEDVKTARLEEIIALQGEHSNESNRADIGRRFEVLVEGVSRKSEEDFCGRTEGNKMVVFPRGDCKVGDYVEVQIQGCTSSTLLGHLAQ